MATYPDLQGKVVLLTGIGQQGDPSMWGNGAATARVLAHNGAKIFGCDLNLSAAQHTQRRIVAEGADCTVVATDVTKGDEVKALVDACVQRYGRIDILINNVGKSEPGGPAEMSEETWAQQTDVNLKSVYLCCHHVLPVMEAQETGGVVVNVSSIAGIRYIGKPQVADSATKAAVQQFTKATAVIYAKRGVRLNTVVPGLIDTPLVGILADKYAGGDLKGFTRKEAPACADGKMRDAITLRMRGFLRVRLSKYITGQELVVDGGITSSTG
ncbi:3-oxoacyl-[acyl-carrier-protein] reductase [Coccidioides immitis H538.4]|uniref:3-oxoacyl-[acyl-carrier-protein] reductase n=1 Tax=Coccidioides immitis H538.4 TaxID=396776 RepID=A0A0J8RQ98_COCIT|nr:3-oxoacyl-[acyl-carrier-protein] reductase [Coccidioides immitis H538.4]